MKLFTDDLKHYSIYTIIIHPEPNQNYKFYKKKTLIYISGLKLHVVFQLEHLSESCL